MAFELTAEQEDLRRVVRAFAVERVAPRAEEMRVFSTIRGSDDAGVS